MKPGISPFFAKIYHYLLRFFPAEFTAEFGPEMEAVFAEALTDAQQKGFGPMLILFLRELRDLPSSLWRERRRSRQNRGQIVTLTNGVEGPDYWQPATRWDTSVTLLPFVLSGLFYFYEALAYAGFTDGLMSDWDLRLYLVALAGLGIGWIKGFPRWSLSYLGLALILSWAGPSGLTTTRIELFGFTYMLNDFWGWSSFLAVGFYATLFCRSLDPLRDLGRSIWRDWSLLSFILYGTLAYFSLAVTYDGKTWYDPVAYLPLDVFKAALILVIGVLVYVRLRTPLQRALALQGAFSLPGIFSIAIGAITDGDVGGWQGIVFWSVPLLLPGILGLARRARQEPGLA